MHSKIEIRSFNSTINLCPMKSCVLYMLALAYVFASCKPSNSIDTDPKPLLRFEKINYYKFPYNEGDKPIKYRVEYYFENGKSHRWSDLDSLEISQVEYIYNYSKNFKHIGARYKEPSELKYNIENVRFENDSTQITEWLDSTGVVFYTMIDNLYKDGRTYRATFKGKKIDGYDSTFYTNEGFQKRIFFTNQKGEVFNDRSFEYDQVDANGNWSVRRKIMDDTIREVQKRELYYDQNFTATDGKFYPGVISTGELSENVFSFTEDEKTMFLTRTSDWDVQSAFIAKKKNGLYLETLRMEDLDSIYNGAISPNGKKIIYTTKKGKEETTWLLKLGEDSDSNPINLTAISTISAGYFYWLTNSELYFYQEINGGDIFKGTLEDDQLKVENVFENLNTSATEFSPYVDPQKRFVIFTRYKEDDKSQQGFFISYNNQGNWSEPEKIKTLPYGWNARIIQNRTRFLYTDGEDVYNVPIERLRIKL